MSVVPPPQGLRGGRSRWKPIPCWCPLFCTGWCTPCKKGSLATALSWGYTTPSSAAWGALCSDLNPTPASSAGVTKLQVVMSSHFGAGLRHFPMHVLPSQAVGRSGLCCQHSVPACLTPALHLISFLFLGCQNRYVNASTFPGL